MPDAVGEATISVTVSDHGIPPLLAIKSFKLTVIPGTSPNNPPVAVINASPDADLDGGDPEIILISVNGVDAPVTLDGTASSDPDPGDVLTAFSWFADSGSGPTPLGESTILTTRLGIGSHQIFLSVSDGSLASPFAIKHVTVIPVSEAIGYLIAEVRASSITDPSKFILVRFLEKTIDQFASSRRGRLSPCEKGLARLLFFREVLDAALDGSSEATTGISPALATEWIYLTDQIINNVTCP